MSNDKSCATADLPGRVVRILSKTNQIMGLECRQKEHQADNRCNRHQSRAGMAMVSEGRLATRPRADAAPDGAKKRFARCCKDLASTMLGRRGEAAAAKIAGL
jgi:hypothetical protein